MLPRGVRVRLLRTQMQHSIKSPSSNAAPRIEPTTIPAIWPPDSPLLTLPLVPLVLGEGDEVDDGNKGGIVLEGINAMP